ncbi:MAG: hypothetical protein GKS05_12755 [Nitrospirales bacterium]|nr:hypothetical protein [Nitrospirales bacterium]
MLVKTKDRLPLSHLLEFLKQGEQLAHECATFQKTLTCDPRIQYFLHQQAAQEAFHAITFKAVVAWLAPRSSPSATFFQPLKEYRRRLMVAVQRKEFAETILAEQIILEGLGEVILKKIETGLVKQHSPFRQFARLLVNQEIAHHAFGDRLLTRLLAQEHTTESFLQERAKDYLYLAESMLNTISDQLMTIDENPVGYLTDFHRSLPNWIYSQSIS